MLYYTAMRSQGCRRPEGRFSAARVQAAWVHPSGWDKHSILMCGPGKQRSQHGKYRKPSAVSNDFEDCAISPHNAERLLEAGKGQKWILLAASSQEQRLLGLQKANLVLNFEPPYFYAINTFSF